MSKKGSNDIVYCFNVAFCFSILRRGVGTREAKEHALVFKKIFKITINIFSAIVTLKSLNVTFKLRLDNFVKRLKKMFDL